MVSERVQSDGARVCLTPPEAGLVLDLASEAGFEDEAFTSEPRLYASWSAWRDECIGRIDSYEVTLEQYNGTWSVGTAVVESGEWTRWNASSDRYALRPRYALRACLPSLFTATSELPFSQHGSSSRGV